jgi:protein-S-isoprenylcysteine O-methyltransferase Ste14
MNAINLIGILWMVFGLVWVFTSTQTKKTQKRAPFRSRLVYGVPVLLGAYLMSADLHLAWLSSATVLPNSSGLAAVALLLTGAGIGSAIWARMYLGQNWSSAVSVKVGHQLIRTGPYRWVRHPIYAGLLVALIGTALGRRKATAFLAIALFWLGFWMKSRMEERLMRQTFGEEYLEYSRATGALLPRLRQ